MPTDLSDLIAHIETLFSTMSHYEPGERWGWWHPTLVEWSINQGFRSHHHYDQKALEAIKRSLEKKIHAYATQPLPTGMAGDRLPEERPG